MVRNSPLVDSSKLQLETLNKQILYYHFSWMQEVVPMPRLAKSVQNKEEINSPLQISSQKEIFEEVPYV